ncbi:MAG: hypothetical protein Q9166_006902 [cf. Caloplaca sp. 2 TL-2023]
MEISSIKKAFSKVKRGLSGFVNGTRVSALPDTGSPRNVVSHAFAQEMDLTIEGSSSEFVLGNSKRTRSLGTVTLEWAFSENPQDLCEVVCDVLPNCSYSMILGSSFLTATQTLSKHRRRLTECLFSMVDVLKVSFLGNDCQRLQGRIGCCGKNDFDVWAVLDTGAEANIMDQSYAISHNLRIKKGSHRCNLLQFADGTYQETVGQVETYSTFDSGQSIPVTFDVLADCCADVILGDSILYDHNVFENHAASIVAYESPYNVYQLAPFDFVKNWQKTYAELVARFQFSEAQRPDRWETFWL